MPDPMFFMPAAEGMDVPQWFLEYIGSLGTSLDNAFRNIGDWISDPSQQLTIEVQGSGQLTMQEISDYLPISGTIWPFHGSWATAATIRGWVICDGSYGTPKIHPAIDDASPIQRMVRATAYGVDSGTTAGTECHCHTTCETVDSGGAHVHAIDNQTDDEEAHTHSVAGNTNCNGTHCHALGADCSDTCNDCHTHSANGTLAAVCNDCYSVQVCCGTDHCVSQNQHTHDVEGNTDEDCHNHGVKGNTCCDGAHLHAISFTSGVGSAHGHTVDFNTNSGGAHTHGLSCQVTDSVALLPQVIDVIWLMKL